LRSLWKGAISFGLVHIPCRLYPATVDRDVHFRQLHAACHTPIAYRKVCPHCGTEVGPAEIARGYEVAPGEFVLLRDEELAELPLATAHTVQILDFVDLASVDPLYFERAYYVGPADGGARPYALLRAVLRRTGRAAVAQVALRAKESLALVRVVGQCLVLELMRYPDEIRDWHEVEDLPGELPLGERELEVATHLVERLSGPWEPARYRDTYRDALHGLISAKAAGERVRAQEPEAPAGRYADLLAALEESVRQAERRRSQQAGAALH
jgi:DNA end-binding protein Ku